ncbi:MAG: tyrosine-type recombinase/integrase, partial [Mycobacteriales bacterium]
MSIVARKRSKITTYYAVFTWNGKKVWERAGTDRREAVRLEKRRRTEIATGTYQPQVNSSATTVSQFAKDWLAARRNRTADDDRARIRMHVLSRVWLADMSIEDVRPRHIKQLVEELNASVSEKTGQIISGKMVSNIFGAVRTMFRDARIAELTREDPCVIPSGLIKRKTKKPRAPYSRADARALLGQLVSSDARRVWNALALYTGMREGEVCGRRWGDWDEDASPLGCLAVESQYDGQPLKTDNPRTVPVHPELAAILAWWRKGGFEQAFCRKPKN